MAGQTQQLQDSYRHIQQKGLSPKVSKDKKYKAQSGQM
jgi:hypothetical protein